MRIRPRFPDRWWPWMLLPAFLCSGCPDTCDTIGDTWCDGNKRQECARGSYESSGEVSGTDCRDYDASCIESKDGDGNKRGDCVLSKKPCPGGLTSICVGKSQGSCIETGYPIFQKSCGEESMVCVESVSDKVALCAYADGTCSPESVTTCDDSDTRAWLKCSSSVWLYRNYCAEGQTCHEAPDAGVNCK